MSVSVTFNNQLFVLPQTGNKNWGDQVTAYLVAIAGGALQKSAGLFQLSSELDFGPIGGIRGRYFASRATNIAQSGIFRLGNAEGIYWRDAANAGQLELTVNASDQLTFNGIPLAAAGSGVSSITGTADQITASASTGAVTLSLPSTVTLSATNAVINLTGSNSGLNVSNSNPYISVTRTSPAGQVFLCADAGVTGQEIVWYGHSVASGFTSIQTDDSGGTARISLRMQGGNIGFPGGGSSFTPTCPVDVQQGNIEARNGDIKAKTAGNGLYVKEGSNATMGTATLSGGTVTVNTTKVTANSRIFLTVQGGTLTNVGSTYISARTPGTSFAISSTNVLDAANVAWLIVEPA